MRKRIINPVSQQDLNADHKWLDIEELALVEVSSEDHDFPIESALLPSKTSIGWRASEPGKQVVRLLFDTPQPLKWIKLSFEECEVERTQEYVLRWSPDNGESYQEIVRQQWNFNPENASSEVENYQVALPAVTVLELVINPDISNGNGIASLKAFLLA